MKHFLYGTKMAFPYLKRLEIPLTAYIFYWPSYTINAPLQGVESLEKEIIMEEAKNLYHPFSLKH